MPEMSQPQAESRTTEAPIFIVGLPRSGTTLLAAMLSTHPAIDCGPETFFFARLPSDPTGLLDPAGWPDRALDYVCGLRLRDAPVHELYGRTRQDLRAYLAARPPSLAVMLESLTAARARARGKRRWAEKTPRHLGHVRLIRRTFPEAAILRMIRDPRDAAMSMTRVPFASDSLVANLYLCARAEAASGPAIARDPRSLTVRYEDLVRQPESEARRISRFLGEPFDPRMLDPRQAPTDLAAGHEWWKGKESEPLDPSRVEAWRREMAADDQSIAAVICHATMRRHGYEGGLRPRGAVVIAPDVKRFVVEQEATARSLARQGIVVEPLRAGAGTPAGGPRGGAAGRRTELVFWPLLDDDRWALGRSARTRARALARMAVILGRWRLGGRAAIWIRPLPAARATTTAPPRASRAAAAAAVSPRRPDGGVATRAAELMLGLLGRSVTSDAWLATWDVAQPPAGVPESKEGSTRGAGPDDSGPAADDRRPRPLPEGDLR